MPQIDGYSHRPGDVKFQAGEWYTLYASLFMTILIIAVVSYYTLIAPAESAWKVSKRKKQQ
ncbi:BK channel Interacting Protein [Caenorhabditis elegans]|uniref:BK channel Interacting Protein n=1 Tax=Caenorhabditis elegans TaxID=6239 RepID=G5EFW1_CAEEL|nr:BK channel Interacting Protein [Caenorhabditis elegans]ACV72156.1 BK channel interacting protein 1 [Caenorhabditis elegans]CBK19495.1 BK channel Interacting Protein [Caenorhabditis elegans]|eukprot:NP_001254415.1 BK channel Interacting Protein [Caenorhabditis elegans]